jgi:hypothetical protein
MKYGAGRFKVPLNTYTKQIYHKGLRFDIKIFSTVIMLRMQRVAALVTSAVPGAFR